MRATSEAQPPKAGPAPAGASSLHLQLRRPPQAAGGKLRVRIPAILLEGDTPGTAWQPKRRPEPEPPIPEGPVVETGQALPESYGTGQLRLTPRDPHWVLAYWDFTRQQLAAANAQSAAGHLVLRMFKRTGPEPLVSETPVAPDAVRRLLHAPEPAAAYAAELGFYDRRGQWSALAKADPVRTPPSGPSTDRAFEMATLTPDGLLERHSPLETVNPPEGLAVVAPVAMGGTWHSVELSQPGSLGVTQAFPGGMPLPPSSLNVSSWSSIGLVSSPAVRAPQPSFRFEVNAELIVYGATQPGATLRCGDRIIPLNADGTFRLRFALPDGTHVLPLTATAAGTGERRSADLRVDRQTRTGKDVHAAPPTPGLQPPATENL